MVKIKQSNMILLSGALWTFVGTALMWKGLAYLSDCAMNFQSELYPVATRLLSLTGGPEQAVVVLIFFSLAIGVIKGRTVLAKSAKRQIARINTLQNPDSILRMYSAPYWLLYLFMMSMGMVMKATGCPLDVRGVIDTAVGAALINASMLYYREWSCRRLPKAVPK